MKRLFLYIFASFMIIAAPRVFAQASSNADFNPFPQMEQDQSNVDADTAAAPQPENDDWPAANTNSDAQNNNE